MFIPLGDDNSGRRIFPFVVYFIIAANAVMWWLQLTGGEAFTYALSTVPYEITHKVDLASTVRINMDGSVAAIRHYDGPDPIYLTLLTSMFMHGSWMHIIGNMLYLGIFGDQIEDLFGHWRFAIFYLLSGIAASVAHIATDPNSMLPSLGASGAIAGVLGAYLITHPGNRVRVLLYRDIIVLPASLVLGFWIVLQFIGQAQSSIQGGGIAYMAHIGGFLAGIVLLPILRRRRYAYS